jgi:hypothetical protein
MVATVYQRETAGEIHYIDSIGLDLVKTNIYTQGVTTMTVSVGKDTRDNSGKHVSTSKNMTNLKRTPKINCH